MTHRDIRTPMTTAQLGEITRLMKLTGRKYYGSVVRRVLGPLDRDPRATEATKIIRFLQKELQAQ